MDERCVTAYLSTLYEPWIDHVLLLDIPQRVTCVHKANIMKLGDGLFLNTCRQVAAEYKDSGIGFDEMSSSLSTLPSTSHYDVTTDADGLRLQSSTTPLCSWLPSLNNSM